MSEKFKLQLKKFYRDLFDVKENESFIIYGRACKEYRLDNSIETDIRQSVFTKDEAYGALASLELFDYMFNFIPVKEKLYYIKLKGFASSYRYQHYQMFVNYNVAVDDYFLSDGTQNVSKGIKTKFTQKEVDKLFEEHPILDFETIEVKDNEED